ncbi:hypothetical protein EGW08_003795, partial [Elysia chlorotica]
VNQRAGLTSSPLARPTETSHLHSNQAAAGSQLSGLQATPPFDLGTSNAVSRTNEERKQAIKATALTLQTRLVEERRKLEELKVGPELSHPHSTEPEFVPRYDRITGSGDSFSVFTSHLPGSQVGLQPVTVASRQTQDEAASRIQAAYRGHSVRGALNWGLPSGDTLGHRL